MYIKLLTLDSFNYLSAILCSNNYLFFVYAFFVLSSLLICSNYCLFRTSQKHLKKKNI